MAATFTIAEILAATGGALMQRGAWDAFCGVSTDSRTAQTGSSSSPCPASATTATTSSPRPCTGASGACWWSKDM